MKENLIAETTITIDAGADEVWKAITTPALVEQYLMGTHVITDWKEGGTINYEGEYKGKKYKDKGIIKKSVPGKLFQSTYWSSMGGKEDKPENYNLVTYKLDEKNGKTTVTITQDNNGSEKERQHSEENWNSVIQKLKETVEENATVHS